MEFKTQFTKEEIDDLVEWFETHDYEQDIDIGSGIHVKNVNKALAMLLNIARLRNKNRSFVGQVNVLFRLREALIEQGKVIS